MEYKFSDRVSNLKPSAIREIFKYAADPTVVSLSAGNPSPDAFPAKEIEEISARLLSENPIAVLQYSVTEGYTPLRQHMAEYMRREHNTGSDSDDILITTGAQQIMDLCTKALVNEGDSVICEAPSFIGSLNTFRAYNAKLVGVTVEPDGMSIEELEQKLKDTPNAKFIYTIPNFQNPSGVTMSLEKRKKVYELAKKYGVLILEDNPYGDLRYSGESLPNIKSFDTDGIVVFPAFGELRAEDKGLPMFTVPYSALEDLMYERYLPVKREGAGSLEIVRVGDVQDGTVASIDRLVLSDEGEEMYLKVDGTVYDLRISSMYYVDQAEGDERFYETDLHWYASYMSDCALQLSAVVPNGMPDLMITYTDRENVLQRRFLSESGVDGGITLVDNTIEAVG